MAEESGIRPVGGDTAAAAPDPEATLQMYRSFMEEIKVRTAAVDRYLARVSELKGVGDCFTDAESCILQVRYVCELIALSTVAAHNLVGVGSRLLKSWNAERTFELLEASNPNCFPRAVRPSTERANHFEFQAGSMNLAELRRIYSACGENLHRGAMKHFAREARRGYDPRELLGWVNRIKALLNQHVVMILDHGIVILATMRDERGDVAVAMSRSDGPAVLVE